MRASPLSTADDTRPTEQAFPRRLFVSFGRLSDGQPGKCTESSSGQPGHFTERPSVRREPALLASMVSPKARLGPPLSSNGPTAVVGNGAMTPALLTMPSAFENLSRPI